MRQKRRYIHPVYASLRSVHTRVYTTLYMPPYTTRVCTTLYMPPYMPPCTTLGTLRMLPGHPVLAAQPCRAVWQPCTEPWAQSLRNAWAASLLALPSARSVSVPMPARAESGRSRGENYQMIG